MYISEIDELLNETLNNFMGIWILESKISELLDFKKLIKEVNFIKYQKQINEIIEFGDDNDSILSLLVVGACSINFGAVASTKCSLIF